MKKLKFIIPIITVLVVLFAFSGVAMADDPTTTTITWNGAGGVAANVDCGDSNAGFTTVGDAISGTYTATDSNNNPLIPIVEK